MDRLESAGAKAGGEARAARAAEPHISVGPSPMHAVLALASRRSKHQVPRRRISSEGGPTARGPPGRSARHNSGANVPQLEPFSGFRVVAMGRGSRLLGPVSLSSSKLTLARPAREKPGILRRRHCK